MAKMRVFIFAFILLLLTIPGIYGADFYCSGCGECTNLIQNIMDNQDVLYLSSPFSNDVDYTPICLNLDSKSGITIDCQGINIIGTKNTIDGHIGINLPETSSFNTIQNCDVSNFYEGVKLVSSNSNTLNNLDIHDNYYGLVIMNSISNEISDSIIEENIEQDVSFFASSDLYCQNTFSNILGYGRDFMFINSQISLSNQILSGLVLCNADNSILDNVNIAGSEMLRNNIAKVIHSDNVQMNEINYNHNFDFQILDSDSGLMTNSNFSDSDLRGLTFGLGSEAWTISSNHFYENGQVGLRMSSSPNFLVFDNFFNNTNNVQSYSSIDWNSPLNCGTESISGGYCKGGNYWANPDGTGFSESCVDSDSNGICDSIYSESEDDYSIEDNLPLRASIPSCFNDNDCSDGTFCNGVEICSIGNCISGNRIDCSKNNLNEISSCSNTPDNNPFTFDFLPSFISVCDEINDVCTTSSVSLTHTCSINSCSAECTSSNECVNTVCDSNNGCYDGTFRRYQNISSTCDGCQCQDSVCNSFILIITDIDGDGFDIECDGDFNDTDNTSFPGAVEICDSIDNDGDGYIDNVASCNIEGNESDIVTNFDNLTLNISEDVVIFISNDLKVLEFEFNASETILNLSEVKIEKNNETDNFSFIKISGINLASANTTKTVYFEAINDVQAICIYDSENVSLSDFTESCNSANEILLVCDGINNAGYGCNKNLAAYTVSGLKHSFVREYLGGIPSNDEDSGNDGSDNPETPSNPSKSKSSKSKSSKSSGSSSFYSSTGYNGSGISFDVPIIEANDTYSKTIRQNDFLMQKVSITSNHTIFGGEINISLLDEIRSIDPDFKDMSGVIKIFEISSSQGLNTENVAYVEILFNLEQSLVENEDIVVKGFSNGIWTEYSANIIDTFEGNYIYKSRIKSFGTYVIQESNSYGNLLTGNVVGDLIIDDIEFNESEVVEEGSEVSKNDLSKYKPLIIISSMVLLVGFLIGTYFVSRKHHSD